MMNCEVDVPLTVEASSSVSLAMYAAKKRYSPVTFWDFSCFAISCGGAVKST